MTKVVVARYSEGPIVRGPGSPRTRWSEGPIVRGPDGPRARWSEDLWNKSNTNILIRGLEGPRTIGPSDYRTLGLLGLRLSDPRTIRICNIFQGFHTHTHTHTSRARTHAHAFIHTHTYLYTNTDTFLHNDTYIHTYIHTYILILGLSGPRTIGPSDYRALGLTDPRTTGPSEYRAYTDQSVYRLWSEEVKKAILLLHAK